MILRKGDYTSYQIVTVIVLSTSSLVVSIHNSDGKRKLLNIFGGTLLSTFTTTAGKFSKSNASNAILYQIKVFGKSIKKT